MRRERKPREKKMTKRIPGGEKQAHISLNVVILGISCLSKVNLHLSLTCVPGHRFQFAWPVDIAICVSLFWTLAFSFSTFICQFPTDKILERQKKNFKSTKFPDAFFFGCVTYTTSSSLFLPCKSCKASPLKAFCRSYKCENYWESFHNRFTPRFC